MSSFMFATCERKRALEFIQKMHPKAELHDTSESAGPLLDLVAADLIRVQDPNFHQPCQIVPGKNWDESRRDEVIGMASKLLRSAP